MDKRLKICVFLFMFLTPAIFKAQNRQPDYNGQAIQSSKYWQDIDYVGDRQLGHRLDIHLPTDPQEKYPVIICIYGSAWFSS